MNFVNHIYKQQQNNSSSHHWFPLFPFVTGAEGTFHFKLLVPSIAAGAIIGKGGETIAQLQKDAGARVKMSKANDFYPGKIQ